MKISRRSRNHQSGFGAVEMILVLVIVIAIAGVGYFVWQSDQQDNKLLSPVSSGNPKFKKIVKSTASGAGSASTTASSNSSSEGGYVTIPQWHVRAPYSGPLTLLWQYQNDPNEDPSQMMSLSSSQLTAGGPANGCTTANAAAGYIGRYAPGDDIPSVGPPAETVKDYIAQDGASQHLSYSYIGGYYYLYSGGQGNTQCTSQALYDQTQAAFESVASHLRSY